MPCQVKVALVMATHDWASMERRRPGRVWRCQDGALQDEAFVRMNQTDPKLAVVIPVWNDAEALGRSLSKFKALDTELLDQLNWSPPTEHLKTRRWRAQVVVSVVTHMDSQKDGGVYDAMNRGVSKVSAPWIWMMGAGDIPMEKGLKGALDILSDAKNDEAHAFAVGSDGELNLVSLTSGFRSGRRHALAEHHAPPRPHCSKILVAVTSISHLPRAWRWCLERLRAGQSIHCHLDLTIAKVSSGGLSRSFTPALYG